MIFATRFVCNIKTIELEDLIKDEPAQKFKRKKKIINLKRQLSEKYPPKNDIEQARNCTIKIKTALVQFDANIKIFLSIR